MKIVPLKIDESDILGGVNAISLVDFPAIEENFIALKNERSKFVLAKADKQVLVGPALIPNKMIYRYDENTGEDYQIYFTKRTVSDAAFAVLRKNRQNNYTEMHSNEVGQIYLQESWIIEDEKNDKSNLYGFKLPKGTWMVSVKVENEEIWNKVKSGELRGFSIEAFFVNAVSHKSNDIESVLKSANEELKNVLRSNN